MSDSTVTTEIAMREDQPAPLLEIIRKAASDENFDADKMDRIMAAYERSQALDARRSFTRSMAAVQPLLPSISKNGEIDLPGGKNKPRFAKWEDIHAAIMPILNSHGFSLSFETDSTPETVTVTAVLMHEDGHQMTNSMTLPADNGPGRNKVQALGSSLSYAKRYTATLLLNIRIAGEDDDGQKAISTATITKDQVKELLDLIEETDTNIEDFCHLFNIAAIPDMTPGAFDAAKNMLDRKKVKKGMGK